MKMSVYERKAKAIGVTIEPSRRQHSKYDVFKGGVYQASIGDSRYKDYERYRKEQGQAVADKRRAAWRARHVHRTTKYRDGKLTAAYLASEILW